MSPTNGVPASHIDGDQPLPDLILRLHRDGLGPDEIAATLARLDRDSEADAAGISIRAVIEEADAGVPVVDVPQGWKLVPVEPSEEMAYRGGEATAGSIEWDDSPDDAPDQLARAIYRAMLKAAPAPGVPVAHDCLTCAHRDSPGAKGPCKSCTVLWKPENGGHDDNWTPIPAGLGGTDGN